MNWNAEVDFHKLPDFVKRQLIESRLPDTYNEASQEERDKVVEESFKELYAYEVLEIWLQYEGIIGYAETIRQLIEGIFEARKPY